MHERCCSHYDIDSKRILLFLLFLLFMPLSQIKPCIDVVIPKGIDYRIAPGGQGIVNIFRTTKVEVYLDTHLTGGLQR